MRNLGKVSSLLLILLGCTAAHYASAMGRIEVTATDTDGTATGEAFLYRWSATKKAYSSVSDPSLKNGKQTFEVKAGRYKVGVRYFETSPTQWQSVQDIDIADDQVQSLNFYFSKGYISVTATDHDGWVTGETFLYQWKETDRKYVSISDPSLKSGKYRFSVPPGMYRIGVRYFETSPSQWKDKVNIQVGENADVEVDFHFHKGRISTTAIDSDGWASGELFLYQWHNEKRSYQSITDPSLSNGKKSLEVPPGLYKVGVRYFETTPSQWQQVEHIEIEDQDHRELSFYFPKGHIAVTATDGDGWASGEGQLYRWDSKKDQYTREADPSLKSGKYTFSVPPGLYRLNLVYFESKPTQTKKVTNILVEDRMKRELLFNFGGNYAAPPLLEVNGPLEVGDGDGLIEVGESVVVKFSVSDSDFHSGKILINSEEQETFLTQGFFERTLHMKSPGTQKIEIVVKDKAIPYNVNSWSASFPVTNADNAPVGSAQAAEATAVTVAAGMRCPKCTANYPMNALFCVKDGGKLVSVSQAKSEGNDTADSKTKYKRTPVIDRVLDFALRRAGIDPTTEEAKAAKKISKNTFNPFKTGDDMQRDLDAIVKDILNSK